MLHTLSHVRDNMNAEMSTVYTDLLNRKEFEEKSFDKPK